MRKCEHYFESITGDTSTTCLMCGNITIWAYVNELERKIKELEGLVDDMVDMSLRTSNEDKIDIY